MTDKARQRRAALAKQLGVSRRTAANIIRSRTEGGSSGPNSLPPEVVALLAELHASSTFSVQTGRAPAVGGGSMLSVAQAQANRIRENPWYAESGAVQRGFLTQADTELLLRYGAGDGAKVQFIRTFVNDERATFAEQCGRCSRWIYCGTEECEAECVCGQTYRVVFDLPETWHWTQRQGWPCMDCGKESGLREWTGHRQSWHVVNRRQLQCDACHESRPVPADKGFPVTCTIACVAADCTHRASWVGSVPTPVPESTRLGHIEYRRRLPGGWLPAPIADFVRGALRERIVGICPSCQSFECDLGSSGRFRVTMTEDARVITTRAGEPYGRIRGLLGNWAADPADPGASMEVLQQVGSLIDARFSGGVLSETAAHGG